MNHTETDLREAKRQMDSTLRKIREAKKSLELRENSRLKAQITLASRRIDAFELANSLIERELLAISGKGRKELRNHENSD